MATDFIKSLEQMKVDFDKKLLSVDFWNDEARIETYCRAIMDYCNVERKHLSIRLTAERAFEVENSGGTSNVICLPRLIPNNDPDVIFNQIYARAMLLRHELAHIIFTDNSSKTVLADATKNDLYGFLEDARIEALFASRFRGSTSGFHGLIDTVLNTTENIQKLYNKPTSYNLFAFYFRLRAAGVELPNIPSEAVDVYKAIFDKYGFSLLKSNNAEEAYRLYNTIHDELAQHIKTAKQQDDQSEEEQKSQDDDTSDEGDMPSPDESGENEAPESDEGEMPESNEESDETSSGDDESEDKAENSEKSDDASADSGEAEDGESSADGEDGAGENTDDDEEDKEEKESDNISDPYDELKNVLKATPHTLDIANMDIINDAFPSCPIIPLNEILKLANGKIGNEISGFRTYNKICLNNKATISAVVKFLALKLQHKNKIHELKYQPEGDLDQDNLKEIIINANEPHAFARQIKKVTRGSRIVMLIDHSGSMHDHQTRDCIINCIILMEVCKKLNINYEINLFTSSRASKYHVRKISAGTLRNRLSKYPNLHVMVRGKESRNWSYLKSVASNFIVTQMSIGTESDIHGQVYLLKSYDEKHSKDIERTMGCIYEEPVKHLKVDKGGTPEFVAMSALWKRHKSFTNTTFFIFNDGQFDRTGIEYWQDSGMIRFGLVPDFIGEYVDERTIFTTINDIMATLVDIQSRPDDVIDERRYDKQTADRMKIYYNNAIHCMLECYSDVSKRMREYLPIFIEKMKKDEEVAEQTNSEFKHRLMTQYMKIDFSYAFYKSYRGVEKDKKVDIDFQDKYVVNYVEANFSDKSENERNMICMEISNLKYAISNYISNKNYTNNIIYGKFINNMRKHGHRVLGFGIRSAYGLNYIGKDYFTVVENSHDIKLNFAAKLREIW